MQGVPVVGRRDDDGIDIAVVEQLAEVAVAPHAAPQRLPASSSRPACASATATMFTSGWSLKVEHVPLADQAVADESDADLLVRGDGRAGGGNRGCGRTHKCPPVEQSV